jgi:NADP-dependent 3-hydroxy acid dehydrogenase YdfG
MSGREGGEGFAAEVFHVCSRCLSWRVGSLALVAGGKSNTASPVRQAVRVQKRRGAMPQLQDKIAWVTGAGTGIGEAAALALAKEGASVVLTGRRLEPLEAVAERIIQAGGSAHVQPGDMTVPAAVAAIADYIKTTFGRLDIMVANAGVNIRERTWAQLTAEGADSVITGNLTSVFYCTSAVLPMMRAQKDGVVIITASLAGRFISPLSGAAYTAAKHGVVAMSHTINMEECIHGIRATAVLPGEVATPILDKRPTPVSAEDRAKMVQSEDVGDLIRYIACLPPHVVLNEVMITPTWNRSYVAALGH